MNRSEIHCLIISISLCLQFDGCCKESIQINRSGNTGNSNYTICETSSSKDDAHQISTFVTPNAGMGLLIDGIRIEYNDVGVRYNPIINDSGNYAWIQQISGKEYDLVWKSKSILHSGAALSFLTVNNEKAVCVQSDLGYNLTRIWLINMMTGACECVKKIFGEYIEDVCSYGSEYFCVVTCKYNNDGEKLYNLYTINGNMSEVSLVINDERAVLSIDSFESDSNKELIIEYLHLCNNDKFLYNALDIYRSGAYNDLFAYGNNFRGRLSWDVSYRLMGLCELYKKLKSKSIKERIQNIVIALLNSRNKYIGINEIEWNSDILWSSCCYSLGYRPINLLCDDCELLSAMLYICTEGLLATHLQSEIIKTALSAYDYYEKWFNNDHYILPYGCPMQFDGIVVPWNWQNSMADVCLQLYMLTKDDKYLERCEKLLITFISEWKEESNRIYWHYWPKEFYDGWEIDENKSMNTPSRDRYEDRLFEDASHAGISIRLICRYYSLFATGVISEQMINKIESNMNYFCFRDGFSQFISGDESYVPREWHYWISPYFAYLNNEKYQKYVRQGYLKCFPCWDSQGSLFANSKFFESNLPEKTIKIDKYILSNNDNGQLEFITSQKINRRQLLEKYGVE